MKSPNNRGDRIPTGHLWPLNEASSTRIGLPVIELLAQGSNGNPQTTHAVAKTIDCSLQTDKSPLLKTIPISNMEMSSWCLHPYVPASLLLLDTLHAIKS